MDANNSVRDFVLDTIASAASVDRTILADHTSLYDLAVDSMSRVAVISHMEARYSVEFTADHMLEALDVQIIGDLVKLVESVVVAK